MRHIIASFILLICATTSFAQGPENVIPVPSDIIITEGTYSFDADPKVSVTFVKKGIAPEGYELTVTPKGVKIKAATEAGAFYARQTLDQMTREGCMKEIKCCKITDAPRFPYRGLHVDVSRHFRSLDFLKKQVDAMAMFKMNRMHIHLTDAAGWRMQIDAYPRLTSFAAWRPQATWKEWWAGNRHYAEEGTDEANGGYYTKDQMRELVEYAKARHIEIIPEIEMPSHS